MPGDAFIPVFDFRDGRLWIADQISTIWIRGWPAPEAQQKTRVHDWQPFWPAFRLLQGDQPHAQDVEHPLQACDSVEGLGPRQLEGKRKAYAAFRQTLPPDYAAALEGFTSHQWNLIQVLHERPVFLDLLRANPVLAWCVGNNDQFRKLYAKSSATRARWHMHEKQRELMEWLGFPGTESAVKLMKKIRLEAVRPASMCLLQSALQAKAATMKMLSQLDVINFGALYLACHGTVRDHATFRLLNEVARLPSELTDAPTAGMLIDTLNMWHQLGGPEKLPAFQTTRAISRQHDELVAIFNRPRPPPPQMRPRWTPKMLPTGHFPDPPLEGTAGIVPIRTHQELVAESREQHNCAASQTSQIYQGRYYIYRVLEPERATLAIAQGGSGYWHEVELRIQHNQPVKPETLQFVRTWLWRGQFYDARRSQ